MVVIMTIISSCDVTSFLERGLVYAVSLGGLLLMVYFLLLGATSKGVQLALLLQMLRVPR